MKSLPPYKPIACSFYDRLQQFATQKEMVIIHFYDSNGNPSAITDKIIDVFTENNAEYLRLSNEKIIRLDNLISADNNRLPNKSCGIDSASNPCGDADEY